MKTHTHYDEPKRKPFARGRGSITRTGRAIFGIKLVVFAVVASMVIPLSAFEAHILNVTARIENRPCDTLANFDTDAEGNAIVPGQQIDSEYADWGLTIFVKQTSSIEPDLDHPSIAFGSDVPTGGQPDLGTTNEDFGGPGIGDGGRMGQPGENNHRQHNLLIVADNPVDANNDELIDEPKSDDGSLSKLMLVFTEPTKIYSMRFVDVDTTDTDALIRFYDKYDVNFLNVAPAMLGDNSNQLVDFGNAIGVMNGGVEVKAIKIRGNGSVGIDDICFDRVKNTVDTDHIVINEVYYDTDHRMHGEVEEREGKNEWIELYNPTNFPVNLKNWRITENSGVVRTITTSNRTLYPGQYAVLSKSADTFNFWDIPKKAKKIQIGEEFGNGLGNAGDRVILMDADGAVIDSMSYGTDTSRLDPSVPDAPEGHSLARVPDGVDTDTAADWVDRAEPTPGDGDPLNPVAYGDSYSVTDSDGDAFEEPVDITASEYINPNHIDEDEVSLLLNPPVLELNASVIETIIVEEETPAPEDPADETVPPSDEPVPQINNDPTEIIEEPAPEPTPEPSPEPTPPPAEPPQDPPVAP